MFSLISKNTDLGKYSYFLGNQECSFHRYCDTGFKTKWTGFWGKNKKFLEFFAFKIGESYLSEGNCIKASYDFVKALHVHRLSNETFMQSVWIPRHGSCIVLELQTATKKFLEAELELAINMRYPEENWHERRYWVENLQGNGIAIHSDIGCINIIPIKGNFSFESAPEYCTHYPSGEKQSYFKPGRVKLSGDAIKVALSLEKEFYLAEEEQELKRKYYEQITNIIKCDNKMIEGLYKNALLNLELLYSGDSYYAGFPWFRQFWARDLFWSMPAFLYAGFLERAKKSLEIFSENVFEGQVPNFIYGEKKDYNSIDSNLLFVSAFRDYVAFSGDADFLEKKLETLCEVMQYVISRSDDSFITHDLLKNETWMDTINRQKASIEVQALFLKALEAFYELVFFAKKPNAEQIALAFEAEGIARKLRAKFAKTFWDEEKACYADRIFDGTKDFSKRPNALVPMMLRIVSRGIEEYEKDDMLCERGVLSLSSHDSSYRSDAYHNGQAWSLCTGWLACAEFACNRPEKAYEILSIMNNYLESDALGCIGESWDSKNLKLLGCGLQLWGAAFVIRAIDEFMLGIRPLVTKNELSVKPSMPAEVNYVERHLNLGGKEVVVSVKRVDGALEVKFLR